MNNLSKINLGDIQPGYTLGHADAAILRDELREILAYREAAGKPVAWEVKGILCHTLEEARAYVGEPEPLYAAPQLPAVPQTLLRELVDTVWQDAKESTEVPATSHADELIGRVFTSEPVSQPYKLPVVPDADNQRPAVWVRLGDNNHAPDCTLDNDEAREWESSGLEVIRMVRPLQVVPVAEKVNSPVIPYGWTDNDSANSALVMLDRIDTLDSADDARIEEIKRIIRHLAAAPQLPAVPDLLPCPVKLEPGLILGKGVRTQVLLDALCRREKYYAELEAMTPEQRAEHKAGIASIKSMLAAAPKPE